jgi:hypothetical protein
MTDSFEELAQIGRMEKPGPTVGRLPSVAASPDGVDAARLADA